MSVPVTVQRALGLVARRHGARVAVRHGDATLTFAELDRRAAAIAQGLMAAGLARGDRVAVMLPNCADYIAIAAACAKGALCMVPVNYRYTGSELRRQVEDCGAKALVCDTRFDPQVADAALPGSVRTIRRGPELEAMIARASDAWVPPEAREDDLFYLGYTSGTTGRPKGAMVTQRNRALAYLYWATEFGIGSGDVALHCGPFHHTAPFTFTLAQLAVGGSVVVLDSFDAVSAASVIARHGVTWSFMVPFMLERVLETTLDGGAAPTLRMLISGASPLSTRTRTRVQERFPGVALHDFYGATEAGVVTNLRPEGQSARPRCVGLPIAGIEVQIRDERRGIVTEPGVVGDIWLRGPTLFAGYFMAPEKTAEVSDGQWCTLGDIGYLDEDGYLYLVDRRKDVIKSGGVNIYPIEIEEVLLREQDVRECAVVGVPDERWGEAATAFLVLKDAADAAQVQRRVQELCKSLLADYKRPKAYRFLAALPRNANGKVLKRDLREAV
ncbi:AMP-binding protein [Pigmentiphaga sp. YJ18]|uniref:class I adenylate-forming enzyme family protein n=1 Tax=Pigmentiphaga sp. YJ18 TaxID=3134907 RepID=UPI00310DD5D8